MEDKKTIEFRIIDGVIYAKLDDLIDVVDESTSLYFKHPDAWNALMIVLSGLVNMKKKVTETYL